MILCGKLLLNYLETNDTVSINDGFYKGDEKKRKQPQPNRKL